MRLFKGSGGLLCQGVEMRYACIDRRRDRPIPDPPAVPMAKVEQERDFLREAAAYFARESK